MEMGNRRACDGAVGNIAVISRPPSRPARVLLPLALTALGGCQLAGDLVSAAAGCASGAATGNPAVGIAVGVAVHSGIDATANYIVRTRQCGCSCHDEGWRAPAVEDGTLISRSAMSMAKCK